MAFPFRFNQNIPLLWVLTSSFLLPIVSVIGLCLYFCYRSGQNFFDFQNIIPLLLAIGICLSVSFVTAQSIIKPIKRMNKASKAISKGEFHQYQQWDTNIRELKTLSDSFNQMSWQLESAFSQLQQAFVQSEDRYCQILQEQTDFILRSLPDTTITFANQILCQAWGYEQKEIIGKKWINFVSAEDLATIIAVIPQLTLEKPNFITEKPDYFPNGKRGWTHWIHQGIFNQAGELIEIQSVGRDITELKETELALRKSEVRFHRLSENIPAVIYQYVLFADGSQKFTYLSPKLAEIYQLSPEDVIADVDLIWQRVHPDDLQSLAEGVQESADKLSLFSCEHRLIMPDNTIKWMKAEAKPEKQPNGDIIWDGLMIDITKRVESISRLEKIAQHLPGVIYQYRLRPDGTFHFPYSSQGIKAIYSVTPEQVRESADGVFKVIHTDDLARVAQSIQESAQNLTPWRCEYRVYHNDEDIRWVLGNSTPQKELDGSIIWHGYIYDITDRKKAQEKLQRTSQRLALSLESGKIGCWDWDFNTNIVVWDKRMYELYGLVPQSDTVNYDVWANALHPEDRITNENKLHKAVLEKGEYNQEFRIIHPDGSIHYIQAYGIVVKDAQGNPQSMIGVNYDISDRKQIELALAHAKEVAESGTKAKSQFLANMSHEIRTPMNGVIGMADLLSLSNLTSEQRDFVNTIKDSGQTLLVIINDILDFSKIESGMLELENHRFNLGEILNSVCQILSKQAEDKDINLSYQLEESLPSNFQGDSTRLRQICLNLIANAVKFTDSGNVCISVQERLISDDTSAKETNSKELLFAVKDTGIGIKSDRIYKLFQAFSQADTSISRKYGGTGLGLAISKNLIQLMGGTIWVESLGNVGGNPPADWKINFCDIQGSTFYFTLTLEALEEIKPKNQYLPAKITDSEQNNRKKSLKILLAEDNKINRKVALLTLKKLGYQADVAGNGLEVLQKLEQQSYDVILMDMQMPEMDGLTATKIIRETFSSQPYIIALTANALEEDRQKCLSVGMNHYISKPIRIKEIEKVLKFVWQLNSKI